MKKLNNPWYILGVEPNASLTAIKKAYKRLAIRMHPDKGGSVADWLHVSQAYEKIIKGDLVPVVKGKDVKYVDIYLTIAQQIKGFQGFIVIDETKELYLKVKIPAGALKSDKFKVMHNTKKYIINIKEKADKVFTRQGNNVIVYKKLDIVDIMKQKPFVIISPLGEYIEVQIPPNTDSGSIIVVKEQGLYNRRTKKRGNLRINVKVNIPTVNKDNVNEIIKRLKDD
jgi:DnaJ-class molecular chaperone